MLLLLATLACTGPAPETAQNPPITPGAPLAGAAEATLDLPIGTPMGGYSSRCNYLGSASRVDNRDSAYTVAFMRTAGVHTRPWVKALWLENGDDHLVVLRADTIYSYDGLVQEVRRQLEEATGLDLEGRVILSASHSHNAPSNYSDQIHFYLGGDRYNEENFQRFAQIAADTALLARQRAVPAALGLGWEKDWDPNDRVYRDRRSDNNTLAVWPDAEPGYGKDPYLGLLRVDEAQTGAPIAILFNFGMHGTLLGDENPLYSTDSTGGIEVVLQEQFDREVVVMHLQGSTGDASPAGTDEEYARAETLGEYAVDALLDLWERTPTSTDPIRMETASRHIPQHRDDIRVTRDGAVDWVYRPYEEGYRADDVIYGPEGELLSPFDEFNAPYGAAFCGSDAPLIPAGNIGSEIFPYVACMDVQLMSGVLAGIFGIPIEEFPLPLPESLKAGTTVSRIGPLATLSAEGETLAQDWFVGWFPGEVTGMYAEQWRRRASAELGVEHAMAVGYAQDHEGYLLIPEDWLVGGYEPNINLWGPLQAEHVMEGMLTLSQDVLSTLDEREDPDPLGTWSPTTYATVPLPTQSPDTTPLAGTRITEAPEYLYLPREMTLDLAIPATCPRVQCVVQLAWYGGDPAVDLPRVVLERLEGAGWVEVTGASGRPITDAWTDILTTWTPLPLYPHEDPQEHPWWAAWQAVGHVHDRPGLPLGTYRLRVDGQRYIGAETSWPYTSSAYTLASDPFEVVPAAISLAWQDAALLAWIQAPAEGWRLIDLEGTSRGSNPVRGPLTVTWTMDDGAEVVEATEGEVQGGQTRLALSPPAGAVSVRIEDAWGNLGELAL